jgi:hypothetical protein
MWIEWKNVTISKIDCVKSKIVIFGFAVNSDIGGMIWRYHYIIDDSYFYPMINKWSLSRLKYK